MEIYLTVTGELDCTPPEPAAAVADLAVAVARFAAPRIDCAACANSCCAGLAVYADGVFAGRLVGGERDPGVMLRRLLRFEPAMGVWRLPQTSGGRCRFLAGDGRCLIYLIRPLVCRLHICIRSEAGFARLKEDIYLAYHQALAAELAGVPPSGNPVSGAADYDASIAAIIEWAKGTTR